jgi:arsenate reductase
MQFWHNPRCRKSREALALLEDRDIAFDVVEYLKTPPSADEIKAVLVKLRLDDPRALMRTGQSEYKDQGLAKIEDPDQLIQAMADTPILIERPVFIVGDKAAIGRPPEKVLSLLD